MTTLSPSATPTPATDDIVKDVDIHNFMQDVLQESQKSLVIVDFWAPWCGPCKQLGPVLEKIVRSQGGVVKLAKIDIDKNQEIAAQMRVQSIPAVFAFYGGQPVDGFMGAVPESQIKAWIEKLMAALHIAPAPASPKEQIAFLSAAADEAITAQSYDQAMALFQEILNIDHESAAGYAGCVRVLIAQGAMDDAAVFLSRLPDNIAKDPAIGQLRTAIEVQKAAAAAADGRAENEAKLAKNPNDHAARFDLAMALYAAGDREGALDQLLDIITRDRKWNDEAARKQLLQFFEAIGPMDPLTVSARKRLSSILFS